MILGVLVPAKGSKLPTEPSKWNFLRTTRGKDKVIVFTPRGVNYATKGVYGYVHKPRSRGWAKGIVAIPDVIINYSNTASITNTSLWRLTKGRIFNSHLWVSKWATGLQLKQAPRYIANVPPTYSTKQFDHLLPKWGSIYLKPTRRAQGRGIIQVKKLGGQYRYSLAHNKKGYQGVARSLKDLKHKLKRTMGRDSYLIQKDIKLASVKGRKFDFRVMTFKRPNGTWKVIGSYAKLAPRGHAVTNVSQGAGRRSARSTLVSSFGTANAGRINNTMKQQAIRVSQYLAKYYAHLALLGLDFGVDKHGKVWFIEANALPGLTAAVRSSLAPAIWRYSKSLL